MKLRELLKDVEIGASRADLDRDTVLVDGRPLTPGGGRTYLMLNKPRGYVTTLSDEKGRKTVTDLVAGCGVRVCGRWAGWIWTPRGCLSSPTTGPSPTSSSTPVTRWTRSIWFG